MTTQGKRQRYWDYPSKMTVADIVGPSAAEPTTTDSTLDASTDATRALMLVKGPEHEVIFMTSRLREVLALDDSVLGKPVADTRLGDPLLLAMINWTRASGDATRKYIAGLGIAQVCLVPDSPGKCIGIAFETLHAGRATA